VGRLASLFLVAILTLGASGVPELISLEPCAPGEVPTTEDGGCGALCVKCTCCAQPTDLFVAIANVISAPAPDYRQQPASIVPTPQSREILHIPKPVRV
jgi:hypothetical protein